MTVWITKYALTKGIYKAEARDCFDTSPDMIVVGHNYFHNKEWYRDEESAKRRAAEMRDAKIKSLEKQLEKLRKLEISCHN